MRLLEAGVNVGIGAVDGYAVRNTRFEAAWVRRNCFSYFFGFNTLTLLPIDSWPLTRLGRLVNGKLWLLSLPMFIAHFEHINGVTFYLLSWWLIKVVAGWTLRVKSLAYFRKNKD
jgi:hypothetical protein